MYFLKHGVKTPETEKKFVYVCAFTHKHIYKLTEMFREAYHTYGVNYAMNMLQLEEAEFCIFRGISNQTQKISVCVKKCSLKIC